MSVILVNRPPRSPGPEMPDGEIQLQEPPSLPEPQSGLSAMISMAPTALSSLAMVMIFLRPGSGGALQYMAIGRVGAAVPTLAAACRFSVESLYAGHPVGVHGTDKFFHTSDVAEKIIAAVSY